MSARTVRVGELVEIKGGGTPSKAVSSYWNGSIPWASVKDFKTTEISQTVDNITEEGVINSATNIIPAGNILVPTRMAVGKAAINAIPMAINQDIKALLPHSQIFVRYLLHALLANAQVLERFATGATVKGITLDVLRNLQIPLPPLDEQKRIATILDKADQLRQKRRQAIALLDSLTQSIFLEMFGEAASQDWPSATIGEAATDVRTGPFGSQLLHSEFVDDGIAVLGIDNAVNNRFEWGKARFITEDKYQHLSRYTVKPDDVLITIMGTCGRCAVVPDDIPTAINTKHLCCITLDRGRVLPQYLHACFLNNRSVLRQLGVQAKGAVMPGLNMGIIKSLNIPIPPIALQQTFKQRLASLSRPLLAAERAVGQSDALFSSLQHRAFSGEL